MVGPQKYMCLFSQCNEDRLVTLIVNLWQAIFLDPQWSGQVNIKSLMTNFTKYSLKSLRCYVNTTPLTVKSLNTSQRVRTFTCRLPYMESQVFKIVKLTLHLWQSKLHLSILLNRMASPQNCSYRKPTIVMLTLHLVGCPKITEGKSSESRVQISDTRLIIATSASSKRECWNPRLNIIAMT